jgi:hypothetical protein
MEGAVHVSKEDWNEKFQIVTLENQAGLKVIKNSK